MGENLLEDLIKTGIDEIKNNKDSQKLSDENGVIETTKKSLIDEKKTIAKKYIEKNIDDPILQITGVAENYLITENLFDKIKDTVVFEKFIAKSGIKEDTIKKMKELKDALNGAEKEAKKQGKDITDILKGIENQFLDTNPTPPIVEQTIPASVAENEAKKVANNESNQEKPSGNFDSLPEIYKTYITKISSKFPDPKRSNILTYGPIVIQEALKHDETKKLIDKIFAQINKESERKPKALNDKGEFSIGLMQINKSAGHTGSINGKFYDIETPEGNIGYGIAYLAECIRRSNGKIRRGFNIYNGGANLTKPPKEQYAETIMNDKEFKESLLT